MCIMVIVVSVGMWRIEEGIGIFGFEEGEVGGLGFWC